MKHALALIAIALVVTGVSAQSAQPAQPASGTIAGKWTMKIGTGLESSVLDIALNDRAVSGTLDHLAAVGEFVDGKLTMASPASWVAWRDGSIGADGVPNMTVSFATLKDDGTLSGWTDVFLTGYGREPIKRKSWTATRVK